jgi:hypothetical protein
MELKDIKTRKILFVYNIDKIKETLLSPDLIYRSKYDRKILIYYKRYNIIKNRENVIVPFEDGYFAVVRGERWIKTVYPTDKIKVGELVWQK